MQEKIDKRIKHIHGKRCATWETWQSEERDQNGRKFLASWQGCQKCKVKILNF
jgi:hypothetical protein